MNLTGTTDLHRLYREACAMDVIAFKPGNVSYASPGHGMNADTFVLSAQASAAAMTAPDRNLGERILGAVTATQTAVGCNSNLGIVLLCAPLCQAVLDFPQHGLREGVSRVLGNTSVADSLAVYEAIRIAAPGGLGQVGDHDVAGGTRLTLTDVMRYAADRDLVAAQYANGFAELFDKAMPYLEAAMRRHGSTTDAVSSLFLFLLSQYPDTHIRRKYGQDTARRVSRTARDVRAAWEDASHPGQAQRQLVAFDEQLKSAGLNPGTTADFCVTCLFLHHLHQQADLNPGDTRNHSREPQPISARCSAHVD